MLRMATIFRCRGNAANLKLTARLERGGHANAAQGPGQEIGARWYYAARAAKS